MNVKTWMGKRGRLIWSIGALLAIGATATGAYALGVGGAPDLAGLEVVRADDGHARFRLYGLGVGSTREEVDASPLASSVFYRLTHGRMSKLPGEPGTVLSVLPEYDGEGRVVRLNAHYDGNWLTSRRVLSRIRALIRRSGGTCDWDGCRLAVGGEYDGLSATVSSLDGTVAALSILD